MRKSSFVILFFAFVVGWICARLIGQYAFTATDMPQVVVDSSPRTKILVAKTAIPVGMEILAEHVSFVDVSVLELPAQAITSFNDVYRRRPAFPIPVNCPICEDLLITKNDDSNADNANKFVSVDHRIISFDVDWRSKQKTQTINNQPENKADFLTTKKNIDTENIESDQLLKKGNRVDIRVITRRIPKGTLASIKEQVLQTYADKFDLNSVSELVLENVEIYGLSNYGYGVGENKLQKISFLLDESKIEQLTNAAKKGRLRIVARQQKESEPQKTEETTITKSPAEEPTYKGYRSYIKKSKTKTQTQTPEIAEAKPETTTETNTENNNIKIAQNLNTEIPQTPTTQITTPITETKLSETKSDLKTIDTTSPFWVLPFYLRSLFDSQLPQNANNKNTNFDPKTTTPEITTSNYEKETIGSASSNNRKTNLIQNNENHPTSSPIENNSNIVFTKPQIQNHNEQTNDDTGWATTKKYANNKDK